RPPRRAPLPPRPSTWSASSSVSWTTRRAGCSRQRSRRRDRLRMILLGALMGLGAAAAPGPAPDLGRLQEARNVGLASLEQGDLAEAQKRFDAVRKLAHADPLGWADGAVA